MSIFAKSDKKTTLRKHTENLFKVFRAIEIYLPEHLREFVKITIFFHDIGKVIPAFQIKDLGNKEYEPWDISYEIPHSFFSTFWIDLSKLTHEYKNFIISVIAYHHWREGYENYLCNGNKEFKEFCKKALEWKEKLLNNIRKEMSNLEEFLGLTKLNETWLNGIINGRSFASYAVPPYKFEYEPLRQGLHKDWILMSGFLQRCDHFASFCEEEGESFDNVDIKPISFEKLKKFIESDIKLKAGNLIDHKIWQIEKLEGTAEKNIILIAPTGYGKTEFSFLWSRGQKFIYTLPLRCAVNQIFDRAEKIYEGTNVGILHSDADIYLIGKKFEEEAFRVYELSKQLSYPIIISTGDQFFPYAMRPPGYEKIFSIFSYAALVIDEIQAYDPKACAIIISFIRLINSLGGRFVLMTATLPKFVSEAIIDIDFNKINIYEEEKAELSKIFKHKLMTVELENTEKDFEIPNTIIREAVKHAKSKKRILFILNTVGQAQRVYEKIKKLDSTIKVYLLHSMFSISDRKDKELSLTNEFSNPKPENENEEKILVATQVVEASLDIDADILFTEICPLDSLVQRMGRVLRRYFYAGNGKVLNKSNGSKLDVKGDLKLFDDDEPNVYVIIFKNGYESGKGRIYNRELIEISYQLLKDSNLELSEYAKYELVTKLYEELPKESKYLSEFYQTLEILDAGYMSDRKHEALRIFREIYTVPAIPENKIGEFKNSLKEFVNKDNFNYTNFKADVLSKYIVNIDIRRYFVNYSINLKDISYIAYELDEQDEEKIKRIKKWLKDVYVFEGKYDEEIGVVFIKNGRQNEKVIIDF